jgi:Aspartate oxidase
VLVLGSGASGLAAAVSAERAGARVALATKGSIQSCNSAKAQGGIQAAVGAEDSPEQHAEDIWRSSHETADRALVEILTSEAPAAIRWLEELGVEFTKENGGYRLARCGGATQKRLLQVGDRTGHAITAALRDASRPAPSPSSRRARSRDRARRARLARALRRALLEAST